MTEKMKKSEQEWRQQLGEQEYHVLREKGTERAFTGKYHAEKAKGVKSSVLLLHGADDPFVPEASLRGFEKSMRDGGIDWAFAQFGGAVHSYTNPEADGSFNPGAKFHATASERSWAFADSFLAERLK